MNLREESPLVQLRVTWKLRRELEKTKEAFIPAVNRNISGALLIQVAMATLTFERNYGIANSSG